MAIFRPERRDNIHDLDWTRELTPDGLVNISVSSLEKVGN